MGARFLRMAGPDDRASATVDHGMIWRVNGAASSPNPFPSPIGRV